MVATPVGQKPRTRPKLFAGFHPAPHAEVVILVTVGTSIDDWPLATFTDLDKFRAWVPTVTDEEMDRRKAAAKDVWSRDGGDLNHAVLATVSVNGDIVRCEVINDHLTAMTDDWFFDGRS